MDNENLARELGALTERVDNLVRAQEKHIERVDKAFARGSEKIAKLERSNWKQWTAIVLLSTLGGSLGPAVVKALGLPLP